MAIHAYVLMSNHFHLLATPDTADGIPQMMQSVGRRYVRYFNRSQGRTGTLWEGRYRSTLIQAERYLLACMAYIDLNPVRAGIAETAGDYPWSSYLHYVGSSKRPTDHAPSHLLGAGQYAIRAGGGLCRAGQFRHQPGPAGRSDGFGSAGLGPG